MLNDCEAELHYATVYYSSAVRHLLESEEQQALADDAMDSAPSQDGISVLALTLSV